MSALLLRIDPVLQEREDRDLCKWIACWLHVRSLVLELLELGVGLMLGLGGRLGVNAHRLGVGNVRLLWVEFDRIGKTRIDFDILKVVGFCSSCGSS